MLHWLGLKLLPMGRNWASEDLVDPEENKGGQRIDLGQRFLRY